MSFSKMIENRIKKYCPKGGLDNTTRVLLDLMSISHLPVKEHSERVALMVEAVAIKKKKDAKAAFFSALLHDIGKITEEKHLFDGRNITAEEYAEVKKHAIAGAIALKRAHLFTAYSGPGFHHAIYQNGYGFEVKDFPKNWQPKTVKKSLEISAFIGVCDDIDASMTRKTIMKDADGSALSLKERLEKKFPDDVEVIRFALEEAKKIIK